MRTLLYKLSQKIILLGFLCTFVFTACDSYNSPSADPDTSTIPAGTITGTVIDATTGDTVSGVTLTTNPETSSAVTSSAGVFTLANVPSGTYDVIATKTGYSTHTTEEVLVTDETGASVTIELFTGDGTITGTVTNTRDSLLADVSVNVIDENTNLTLTSTTTDSEGSFVIQDVPKGTYTVSFTPSDTAYCSNEKIHLEVTGTHAINAVLSGQAPDSATYVGSSQCETCHSDVSSTYRTTTHAKSLKTTTDMLTNAKTAFQNGDSLSFDVDPSAIETLVTIQLSVNGNGEPQATLEGNGPYLIKNIYGGHLWKENYLIEIGGQDFVLPFAWSIESGTFILEKEESANWFDTDGTFSEPATDQSYEQRCIGCHTTGFEVSYSNGKVSTVSTADSTQRYLESIVGCERCHGPGSNHVATANTAGNEDSLQIVHPRYLSLEGNTEVCGQCHTKGKESQFNSVEIAYPVDSQGKHYRPGKDLDDYFDHSSDHNWSSSGYSKSFPQEHTDYQQSGHYGNSMYNPRCSDCHNAHGTTTGYPNLLKQKASDNTLCLSCHTVLNFPSTYSIQVHTQHPYDPEGTGASRCISCHLTKTGTVANFTDVGGHTFIPVQPSVTLDMLQDLTAAGATTILEEDLIPNPCMQCHNDVLAEAQANGTTSNALGGDPTSEDYLELLSEAFDDKFVDAKADGEYASFSHGVIEGWMDVSSDDHHGLYYLDNPETCTSSCHGEDLEGGELSDGSDVPSCFNCHYPYPHVKRLEVDEHVGWTWKLKHKHYYTESACTSCHGEDYRGGISEVSCYTCHSNPGVDFTEFQEGCGVQACHDTPPAIGAHDVHYNGNFLDDTTDPQYGDTTNYSVEEAYRFACGTCHPTSQDKHRNGTVDVELYNEHADPNTMKGKMSADAAFDPVTRTCNNVYCHSYTEYVGAGGGSVKVPFPIQPDEVNTLGGIENQIKELNGDNYQIVSSYFVWNNFKATDTDKEAYYWSLPLLYTMDLLCSSGSNDTLCQGGVDENNIDVYNYDTGRFGYQLNYPSYDLQQVRRYQTTPNWDGNETLECNGCHSFPPRSYLSNNEWDESDPDWSNGAPNIKMEAAIDKHSFVIPKLKSDGTTVEVGHMANMWPFSNAPLRCQVCHYQTVSKVNLRDWESGEGWSRENGMVQIDNLSIDDKSYHVNGEIDVVFDKSSAATTYRFNNESYGYTLKKHPLKDAEPGEMVAIPIWEAGYYYGVKGKESPGASWNSSTKTCSNVSCHLEQVSVKWTNPYRPYSKAECYQCHQYYSNPRRNEDETMCWPHSDRNGCESKRFIIVDEVIITDISDLSSPFGGN